MTNLAQIFTGLLFDAYVWLHQVRMLVFDNITKRVQRIWAAVYEIWPRRNLQLFSSSWGVRQRMDNIVGGGDKFQLPGNLGGSW